MSTRGLRYPVHFGWPKGHGACCGADTCHGDLGETWPYEGDATCLLCLYELHECGQWPGAADLIRRGMFYASPVAEPGAGYPRLTYKTHPGRTLVLVQASQYTAPVQVGTVRQAGSLPSCRGWQARGWWAGAVELRKRDRRADAGRDLLAAWRALIAETTAKLPA